MRNHIIYDDPNIGTDDKVIHVAEAANKLCESTIHLKKNPERRIVFNHMILLKMTTD